MTIRNMRRAVVAETDMGLYVWVTDEGKLIVDEEGRQLSIPARKGSVKAINLLRDYAYGFLGDMGMEKNGRAVFLPGHRQITDEEYEEQQARQKWGLVPDPLDFAAQEEELKYERKYGKK